MKVLLDECSPAPIKKALKRFEIFTVEDPGLKGVENGELMAAAEGRFDVIITADKNLRYQQNLVDRRIAIIELPFNSWRRLKPLLSLLEDTLSQVKGGEYLIIPPKPPPVL
jgi:predicted nuclease of predicted toxin-antitoxin system